MPNSLFIGLPTEQDVRLMLPGTALDSASSARQVASKFITDAIGIAAQDRGRVLATINTWIEQTRKQKMLLTANDEWQQYQFSKESLVQATNYRAQFSKQADSGLNQMLAEVPPYIAKLNVLMTAAQGYEQRLAWYNVMVQLKEGVGLYQEQVRTSQEKVLKVLDDFLAENPPVPRPEGDAPLRTPDRRLPQVLQPSAMSVDLGEQRKPAEPPLEQSKSSESGTWLGLVVLGLMAATVGFILMKLRKRPKRPAGLE